MSLETYLRSLPGRCQGCGFHESQGCACPGNRLKFAAQHATSTAHPSDRAAVDAAIRQLAATGRPFSANDARKLHGKKGGVVGAAFTAANKAGLIRSVGDETSTDPGTHGHRVYQWVGVAA